MLNQFSDETLEYKAVRQWGQHEYNVLLVYDYSESDSQVSFKQSLLKRDDAPLLGFYLFDKWTDLLVDYGDEYRISSVYYPCKMEYVTHYYGLELKGVGVVGVSKMGQNPHRLAGSWF